MRVPTAIPISHSNATPKRCNGEGAAAIALIAQGGIFRCELLFLSLLFLTTAALAGAPARADALADTILNTQVGANQTGLPMLKMVRDLSTPGDTSGVIWSSDGTKLAAYSFDPGAGLPGVVRVPSDSARLIMVWNADGTVFRELRRSQPFINGEETFAFVAGDKQIVAPPLLDVYDLVLSVFDVAAGKIVHDVHEDPARNRYRVAKLVASPDQSILAVTFGSAEARQVALYSTGNWSKLADLPESPKAFNEQPGALAFSGDGKFLAVCRLDGVVLIYDLSSRRVVQRINSFPDIGVGGAPTIAFSADGTMIAVGSNELEVLHHLPNGGDEMIPAKNPVRLFHVKDASTVAVYSEPFLGVGALAWSPDGRLVAFITGSRVLHLWNPFQPKISEWTKDLDDYAFSLAFSPDGRNLAADVGRNVKVFSVSP
jgi:WD40 repeat protein